MNIFEYIKTHECIKTETPIIIEAGAAEGWDTLKFSNTYPNGKIYSFEPIHEMYEIAKFNTKNCKNVILSNAALSNVDSKLKMYVADRYDQPWGSHSILKPKLHLENHPAITFKKEEEVDAIVLDTFLNNHKITNIDFMWLDMQGHEPTMLMASPHALAMTKYIYSEVNLIELYENIMLYPEYKDFLKIYGFYPIYEDLPWEDAGNVLFKNVNF